MIIAIIILLLAVVFIAPAVQFLPRKTKPKGNGPRIVCIGDSITFGAGVLLTRSRDAWPNILGKRLSGKYEVLNYGISGATLTKEGDQPYRPDFWETAKELGAQIYILMLGTNDSKPQNWNEEAYARQLEERVLDLTAVPSAKTIYLMVPPPAFKKKETDQYSVYKIDGNIIRAEVRGIVKDCAEKNHVELIDLYTTFDEHPEYMSDGVHPNKTGNEIIAEQLFEAIQ